VTVLIQVAIDSVLLHCKLSNPTTRLRLPSLNSFRTLPSLTPNPTGASVVTSSTPSYHPLSRTLRTLSPARMSTVSRAPSYRTEDFPGAFPELTPRMPHNRPLPPPSNNSEPPAYSLTPDFAGGETIVEQGPRWPFQRAHEPFMHPPSPERPLSPTTDLARDFYAAGAEPSRLGTLTDFDDYVEQSLRRSTLPDLFPEHQLSLMSDLSRDFYAAGAELSFLPGTPTEFDDDVERSLRRSSWPDLSPERPLSLMSDFSQNFYAAGDEPLFSLGAPPDVEQGPLSDFSQDFYATDAEPSFFPGNPTDFEDDFDDDVEQGPRNSPSPNLFPERPLSPMSESAPDLYDVDAEPLFRGSPTSCPSAASTSSGAGSTPLPARDRYPTTLCPKCEPRSPSSDSLAHSPRVPFSFTDERRQYHGLRELRPVAPVPQVLGPPRLEPWGQTILAALRVRDSDVARSSARCPRLSLHGRAPSLLIHARCRRSHPPACLFLLAHHLRSSMGGSAGSAAGTAPFLFIDELPCMTCVD
jgi:hypothetical protein